MLRLSLVVVFYLLPTLVYAESDCHSLAKTAMEKAYCQVAATPEAGNLPSFSDFRRNDPQVQVLLLKAPARRLGITLPTVGNRKPPTPRPQPAPAEPSPQQPAVALTPRPQIKQKTTPAAAHPKPAPQHWLADCQLLGESIRCARDNYYLVNNRQNSELASGVLSDDNVLAIPPFTGNSRDEIAVNNYLADSYTHYIDKMLLIGLGGSTITYTKFHYTYWDLLEKGEDFGKRIGKMYDYLKQDKASMAVKARYDQQLPGGIDWCQVLSRHLIVCDNGKKNWVYRRGSD